MLLWVPKVAVYKLRCRISSTVEVYEVFEWSKGDWSLDFSCLLLTNICVPCCKIESFSQWLVISGFGYKSKKQIVQKTEFIFDKAEVIALRIDTVYNKWWPNSKACLLGDNGHLLDLLGTKSD